MQTETTSRQAQIADAIYAIPCKALIVNVVMPRFADLAARKQALEQACSHSLLQRAQLITLDSSNTITQDRQIIAKATSQKDLNFPHYRHMHEPLLWLPDIIAWCYGRGGTWRDAVEPLVTEVIEI
jgi:diadenosine tetraphosphatase ApaH/serine/threonine PP2A family protein phosphatase